MMKRQLRLLAGVAGVFATMLTSVGAASAQISEQVLYSFTGSGSLDPVGSLVVGSRGKLYGATSTGGLRLNNCERGGCGTVFELIPKAGGGWNYHRLYSFIGGNDGLSPQAGLLLDAAGNLYGTTSAGGTNNDGTVFKLTPGAGGVWTESILHTFSGVANGDGAIPRASLTADAAGSLYGTTYSGGATDNGSVFELTPNGDGSWSETIIYSFLGGNIDGAAPLAGVTFDGAGSLYGTTQTGGTTLFGTVFELTPNVGGWTENVLYNFTGNDLAVARAPVWIDATGAVYGTTCGQFPDQGTVFELTNSAGVWTEKTLHKFGNSGDGSCPISGLTPDANGNLYGTTADGGAIGGGAVYKMRRGSTGLWGEEVLYSFAGGNDGLFPEGGVTIGKGNVLYGTTVFGGSTGFGVVYKITQ